MQMQKQMKFKKKKKGFQTYYGDSVTYNKSACSFGAAEIKALRKNVSGLSLFICKVTMKNVGVPLIVGHIYSAQVVFHISTVVKMQFCLRNIITLSSVIINVDVAGVLYTLKKKRKKWALQGRKQT